MAAVTTAKIRIEADDKASLEIEALRASLAKIEAQLSGVTTTGKNFNTELGGRTPKATRSARAGLGLFSYQIQDVAVQLQGGQNALLVFSQQGSQMASVFGVGGIVVGAILSVGAALVNVLYPDLMKSKSGIEDLVKAAKELDKTFTFSGVIAKGFSEEFGDRFLADPKRVTDELRGQLSNLKTDAAAAKEATMTELAKAMSGGWMENFQTYFNNDLVSLRKKLDDFAANPIPMPHDSDSKGQYYYEERTKARQKLVDETIKDYNRIADKVGKALGITGEQAKIFTEAMTKAFETNDYTALRSMMSEMGGLSDEAAKAAWNLIQVAEAERRLQTAYNLATGDFGESMLANEALRKSELARLDTVLREMEHVAAVEKQLTNEELDRRIGVNQVWNKIAYDRTKAEESQRVATMIANGIATANFLISEKAKQDAIDESYAKMMELDNIRMGAYENIRVANFHEAKAIQDAVDTEIAIRTAGLDMWNRISSERAEQNHNDEIALFKMRNEGMNKIISENIDENLRMFYDADDKRRTYSDNNAAWIASMQIRKAKDVQAEKSRLLDAEALKQQQLSSLSTSLSSIANGMMQSDNKETFEEGKKYSLAMAHINAALAVTKAFGQGGFLGWATAAAVGAAAFKQIDAIKATEFGGGKKADVGATPIVNGGGGGNTQQVSVNITGGNFGAGAGDDIVEKLKDFFSKDGVLFDGTSTQGQVLNG